MNSIAEKHPFTKGSNIMTLSFRIASCGCVPTESRERKINHIKIQFLQQFLRRNQNLTTGIFQKTGFQLNNIYRLGSPKWLMWNFYSNLKVEIIFMYTCLHVQSSPLEQLSASCLDSCPCTARVKLKIQNVKQRLETGKRIVDDDETFEERDLRAKMNIY